MVAWYWLILALMVGGSLGVLSTAIVAGGSRGSGRDEDVYADSVHLGPTAR